MQGSLACQPVDISRKQWRVMWGNHHCGEKDDDNEAVEKLQDWTVGRNTTIGHLLWRCRLTRRDHSGWRIQIPPHDDIDLQTGSTYGYFLLSTHLKETKRTFRKTKRCCPGRERNRGMDQVCRANWNIPISTTTHKTLECGRSLQENSTTVYDESLWFFSLRKHEKGVQFFFRGAIRLYVVFYRGTMHINPLPDYKRETRSETGPQKLYNHHPETSGWTHFRKLKSSSGSQGPK